MKVANVTLTRGERYAVFSAEFTFAKPLGGKKARRTWYKKTAWQALLHPLHFAKVGFSMTQKVWFRVPLSLSHSALPNDAFFILAVGLARFLNEDLEFDGTVSPEIVGKVHDLREYFEYGQTKRDIKITCKTGKAQRQTLEKSGSFFTLGLDSFHSLLCAQPQRDKTSSLVYVDGYDVPLSKKNFLKTIHTHIHEVAKNTNTQPIFVSTNLREISDKIIGWGQFHVAALVAVGMLLPLKEIHISGESFEYRDWGLRAGADKLFSTAERKFELVAHNVTRDKKLRELQRSPQFGLMLSHLRVCWENILQEDVPYNCSVCQKCLKTQLMLLALGVEGMPTFSGFAVSDIEKLRLAEHVRGEWHITYELLKKDPTRHKRFLEAIKMVLESPGPDLTRSVA